MLQAVSSLASVALSLNCKQAFFFRSRICLLIIILNRRDNEFRCRDYLPSNAKFPFRWRYVERRQSILHLRRYADVVDTVPIQDLQIVYKICI